MIYQVCWRCRSNPSIRHSAFSPIPAILSTSFTTSATLQILPPKTKKAPDVTPQKGRPATFIKKSKVKSRIKKPAVGERMALRKRIVLSNNNAIAVDGMLEFGVESIGDAQLHGQVVGLSISTVDQLRAVEAFKRTQSWGLFRKPAMLERRETIEYGKLFEEMSVEQTPRRYIRRIIVGERGSGKSMMLLQAMTMAFLKGWVVINLPEGAAPLSPIPLLDEFCSSSSP